MMIDHDDNVKDAEKYLNNPLQQLQNKEDVPQWARDKYSSKYESYDIAQRVADLENILKIQCSKGNYDVDEYMRGMANGLLLAWNTIVEPYGKDVKFFEPPSGSPTGFQPVAKED